MTLRRIESVEELQSYLHAAMQLEHATIPPYLTALYSIHPSSNLDASQIIRVVVVEEMLHLTLAANLLNAVGGTPDLTDPAFVPTYPTGLPDGETDFQVDLQPFSRAAVETFLKIERPAKAPHHEARTVRKNGHTRALASAPQDAELRFYSIGEFYEEIKLGLEHLQDQLGAQQLFVGDPARQARPEHYYSGGGEITPVTDIESAREAIGLISEQGEGLGGGIYDEEGELAHFFRFEQLVKGAHYQTGDSAGHPTGPPVTVDWDAVYPIRKNARIEDYAEGTEARAAALAFNRHYADFLALLTRAYNGSPELLIDAVPEMFRVKEKMGGLMRNPLPGWDGVNAAPTFEVALGSGSVQ